MQPKFMVRILQVLEAASNRVDRELLVVLGTRCLCLSAAIALSMLCGVQSVQGQQSWPTLKDMSAFGRDWQRLSDAGISGREISEVKLITAGWMDKHCRLKPGNKQSATRIAGLSSKHIVLQDGGTVQLAVREDGDWEGDSESCSCAPNLNCHTWIVDFSGDQATVLFEYSGLGIVVLNTSSHGYFDLVTASNRQAGSVDFTHWRFNGSHYEPLRCASERYSPDAASGEGKDVESAPRKCRCP
jgi:hypothetical protein